MTVKTEIAANSKDTKVFKQCPSLQVLLCQLLFFSWRTLKHPAVHLVNALTKEAVAKILIVCSVRGAIPLFGGKASHPENECCLHEGACEKLCQHPAGVYLGKLTLSLCSSSCDSEILRGFRSKA